MTLNPPTEWQHIAVTRSGAVTELRLHTEDGSLVWDATAHQELADVWAWLSADMQTKVVILTGTGDVFCEQINSPTSEREWLDIWIEARRMITGMINLDVPIIAIANGRATIHSELLLLADIVLAVPDAAFSDQAHVVRGIVPGDGVQTVWRLLLGPSRASYYLLTGEEISSHQALRLGLVHEVHSRQSIRDRASELARPLAALTRETLAYTRAVLRAADRRDLADAAASGLAYAGLAKRPSEPPPASSADDPVSTSQGKEREIT